MTDFEVVPVASEAEHWDTDFRLQATIDDDYKILEDKTRPAVNYLNGTL